MAGVGVGSLSLQALRRTAHQWNRRDRSDDHVCDSDRRIRGGNRPHAETRRRRVNEFIRAAGDNLYRLAGVEVEHHEEDVAGLSTHWVTCGPADAPLSILFHGAGGSAA